MQRGGSRGGAGGERPPYFSTKMRPEGPKKIVLETVPPYLRVWMTGSPPPLLSEGLDPPLCSEKRRQEAYVLIKKLRTFPHLFSNVFLTYLTASLTGIYLQTFEFVCPNLLLPVPINQVIVMEISLLVL